VGLISDTHGLLRPRAVEALRGVERIIHAGDVGRAAVLDELTRLAPLTVVRGNVDRGAWAEALPLTAAVEVGGRWIYVVHALADLDLDPAAAGFAAVVHGHSHRPEVEQRAGVWYVNPGSAGPRRFRLPVSLGRMEVGLGGVRVRLVTLEV
jgi:putative phosphoesterase